MGSMLFRGGKTIEVLASGDRTSIGRVSFLPTAGLRSPLAAVSRCADRPGERRADSTQFATDIRPWSSQRAMRPRSARESSCSRDPVVKRVRDISSALSTTTTANLLYAVKPGNVIRISIPAESDGELVGGLAPEIFAGLGR